MIFVGRSFSYETWYQAVRRCWRYGQKNIVDVHLILAEGENEIGRTIDRSGSGGRTVGLYSQRRVLPRLAWYRSARSTAQLQRHEQRDR